MLDLMKDLLGISLEDTSKDTILNHYLSKAQLAIKNYCNIDTIPESLNSVVVDLAIFYYRNKDQEGIKQQTQGSRSQTYSESTSNFGIPESILVCLPLPKVSVVG